MAARNTSSTQGRAPAAAPATAAAWIGLAPVPGAEIRYGPVNADESRIRLLGQITGRRLLLLGSGRGQLVVQVAQRGAKVICIEPDEALLSDARRFCADNGVNVEMYQRDFAELASIRADSVDLVLSVLELAGVADLSRVFRQVHRVLHPEATLLLSLPHPARAIAGGVMPPLSWTTGEFGGQDHGHSIESVFTALVRTGFRVDNLLELAADDDNPFPSVLLMRARRQGAHPTAG